MHAEARLGAESADERRRPGELPAGPVARRRPRHESIGVAVAREAAALDGIPQQDVAFEQALADADEAVAERSRR